MTRRSLFLVVGCILRGHVWHEGRARTQMIEFVDEYRYCMRCGTRM